MSIRTTEIKAPSRVGIVKENVTVFLAGSIEMGTAEEWQKEVVEAFPFDLNVLNPLRDKWDTSWEQSLNSPYIFEQVSWELDMLERADIIPMYFDPTTKSAITLLELGLHATNNDYFGRPKLIVCCPHGFHRKANVDIVCQRYGIPVFHDKKTWMIALKNRIELIKTRL